MLTPPVSVLVLYLALTLIFLVILSFHFWAMEPSIRSNLEARTLRFPGADSDKVTFTSCRPTWTSPHSHSPWWDTLPQWPEEDTGRRKSSRGCVFLLECWPAKTWAPPSRPRQLWAPDHGSSPPSLSPGSLQAHQHLYKQFLLFWLEVMGRGGINVTDTRTFQLQLQGIWRENICFLLNGHFDCYLGLSGTGLRDLVIDPNT